MACTTLDGTPQERLDAVARLAAAWARDPAVIALALRFDDDPARELLAWVQSLPYASDPEGYDVVCGPAQVMREGGDCEDRAALLAALYAARGWRARVAWQTDDSAPEDHVTVQLFDGSSGWFWADPTVPGARIGEEPHAAAARTGYRARLGLRTAGRVDDFGGMGTMYGGPPR